MIRVGNPQDFGAAVFFAVFGLCGLYFGRDLAYGTSSDMGPGYFPMLLSALILLIGIVIAIKALTIKGPSIAPVRFRPLVLIVGTVVLFGYLLEGLGLALATLISTLIVAFARREVKLVETLLLGVGLSIFAVLVFVVALSQPLPAGWWK